MRRVQKKNHNVCSCKYVIRTWFKEVIVDPEADPQNALDLYFEGLPADSVAKMQYATSNFSKGTTRGGIFTQTMNGLSIFTFDEIAKMTAKIVWI